MKTSMMISLFGATLLAAAINTTQGHPYPSPACDLDTWCDCHIHNLLLSVTTEQHKKSIMAKWEKMRADRCNSVSNDTGLLRHCSNLLNSVELQIDFLLAGVDIGGKKLFFYGAPESNFTYSNGTCADLNTEAEPAVITGARENELMQCVVNRTWSLPDGASAWLGITSNGTDDSLQWFYSNASLSFTNFAPFVFPSTAIWCGVVTKYQLEWTYMDCNLTLGKICSLEITSNPTAMSYTTQLTGAVSGVIQDPGTELVSLQDNFVDIARDSELARLEYSSPQFQLLGERHQVAPSQQYVTERAELNGADIQYSMEVDGQNVVTSLSEISTDVPVEVLARNLTKEPYTSLVYIQPEHVNYYSVSATGQSSRKKRSSEAAPIFNGTMQLKSKPPPMKEACSYAGNQTETKGWVEDLLSLKTIKNMTQICTFLDVNNNNSYSDTGCNTTVDGVKEKVICVSSHLTVFAVLLSVKVTSVPFGVKVTSYITGSLSTLFLLATIWLLCKYNRHKKRTLVQINLAMALILLHVFNLVHDLAVKTDDACVAVCFLTHYFLLASAMWMLVEGVRMFMATNDPISFKVQNAKVRKAVFFFLGWVIPLILASFAYGFGYLRKNYMELNPVYVHCQKFLVPEKYTKYNKCVMKSGTNVHLATLVIPFGCVLLINAAISFKVVHILMGHKDGIGNRHTTLGSQEKAKQATKSIFFIMLMLGTTWFLGFFTGIEDETSATVFMYINALANGLQGVFLFFLYCVKDPEIREQLFGRKAPPITADNSLVISYHGRDEIRIRRAREDEVGTNLEDVLNTMRPEISLDNSSF